MHDVAIIGAGPAGATLARLVGAQHKTLLIDRRDLAGPGGAGTDKCCGGLLAPDAQKMLGQLGLGLPKQVLVEPQVFVVRAVDSAGGLQRLYQRHYINIDRDRFDRWLVSLATPHVDARFGCRFESLRRQGDRFAISLSRDGKAFTEHARVVVGADGAASKVRRSAGDEPEIRSYLAVQEWFEAPAAAAQFWAVFDREVTDFYCWVIPKQGALIVGAALPAGRARLDRFELLKEKLRRMGLRLGRRLRRHGCLLLRPTGARQLCLDAGGAILIGEAAGFVSPSSAEGLSYAFASATMLAQALRAGPDAAQRRYRALTRPLRLNIAAKALKARLLYTPAARRLLMATGLGSLPIDRAQPRPSLPPTPTPQHADLR